MGDQRMWTEQDTIALRDAVRRIGGNMLAALVPGFYGDEVAIAECDLVLIACGASRAECDTLHECASRAVQRTTNHFRAEIETIRNRALRGESIADIIADYRARLSD